MTGEEIERHVQETYDSFERRFPPEKATQAEWLEALERMACQIAERIEGVREEMEGR